MKNTIYKIIVNKIKNMSFFLNLSKSFSKTISTASKELDNINTISSEEKEKVRTKKVVSFGEIEIIDVESFKKYNQLDIIIFEDRENSCMECYGNFCNCEIF